MAPSEEYLYELQRLEEEKKRAGDNEYLIRSINDQMTDIIDKARAKKQPFIRRKGAV